MNITKPRTRRTRRIPVTALYDSPETVDRVMERLNAVGMPRDRVEVAVRPAGAARHYKGKGRAQRRDTFRFAGAGALVGLVYGAVISIIIIALPGFQNPGVIAWVQLLGPNFGAMSGALIGAIYGFTKRRKPPAWAARLDEAEDAILVTVITKRQAEIVAAQQILKEFGGRDVQVGYPKANNH